MIAFFKKRTFFYFDFFDIFVTKITKERLQNKSRAISKATQQEHKNHKSR